MSEAWKEQLKEDKVRAENLNEFFILMFAVEELREILSMELFFMGYKLEELSQINEMNSYKTPLGFGSGRFADKDKYDKK